MRSAASLRKLGEQIPWSDFEEAFGEYYSEVGRPAKPVRLMVGLLLLKQMYDQSDEDVVERWVENPYWQQFCGMSDFQWTLPCDPSGPDRQQLVWNLRLLVAG